jgi:DNA-directed RNA polymerase sigma subunit (sigma70/sigma32)
MRIDDPELMTFEEIGEKLGMTGQGARKIYRQAMDKIRRRLKSNGELAEGVFTWLGQGHSNTIGAQKKEREL